jgi:hypothetical protein
MSLNIQSYLRKYYPMAEGLNLADGDSRGAFRIRMDRHHENTPKQALMDEAGVSYSSTRIDAIRKLADRVIIEILSHEVTGS